MRGLRLGARRLVLLVLVPILAFYLFVTIRIAWNLLRDDRLPARGIGLGLIATVVISSGLIAAEIRFGLAVQALSTAYDAAPGREGVDELPLPLAPSGRPDREAADAAFELVQARAQDRPDDWRSWYELGLAYADARDNARGRKAMKRAVVLRAARP